MIRLFSFGFLHGPFQEDADFLIDVRRYIFDPAVDSNLLDLNGLDSRVARHVLSTPLAVRTVNVLYSIASKATKLKIDLTIAVGCAGGLHRSVAIIETIANDLRDEKADIYVVHRDIEELRVLK
jgi:UPF0042 nucleotide-binding protein